MQTYTYVSKGKFELREKPKPVIMHERDAIVKVTLASICSSDLHIKHGSVPRAVPGITVGHEMVGIVEEVGEGVETLKKGDRVSINEAFFLGGVSKTEVLAAFGAHIFFDDQDIHTEPASTVVPAATVPYRDGDNPKE